MYHIYIYTAPHLLRGLKSSHPRRFKRWWETDHCDGTSATPVRNTAKNGIVILINTEVLHCWKHVGTPFFSDSTNGASKTCLKTLRNHLGGSLYGVNLHPAPVSHTLSAAVCKRSMASKAARPEGRQRGNRPTRSVDASRTHPQ